MATLKRGAWCFVLIFFSLFTIETIVLTMFPQPSGFKWNTRLFPITKRGALEFNLNVRIDEEDLFSFPRGALFGLLLGQKACGQHSKPQSLTF